MIAFCCIFIFWRSIWFNVVCIALFIINTLFPNHELSFTNESVLKCDQAEITRWLCLKSLFPNAGIICKDMQSCTHSQEHHTFWLNLHLFYCYWFRFCVQKIIVLSSYWRLKRHCCRVNESGHIHLLVRSEPFQLSLFFMMTHSKLMLDLSDLLKVSWSFQILQWVALTLLHDASPCLLSLSARLESEKVWFLRSLSFAVL